MRADEDRYGGFPDDEGAAARTKILWAVAVVLVLAAAAALWFFFLKQDEPAARPTLGQATPSAAVPDAPPVPALPASPAEPAQPPVKQTLAASSAPPIEAGGVSDALAQLLGRKNLLTFLQTESFPRRFVATIDNLGRAHAPPMAWPVNPTPGRFMVEERDDGPVIAPDNGQRYTPFVLLAESVDVVQAVDLYVRMYPLLQRAYEDLGYPKAYFNDRVLAVIDLLLATPEVAYPLKLELTEVKGPIPSERPWVRYQFADPDLESLAAGQKILLRAGPVNARRLKARLEAFRAEILTRVAPR